MVVYVHEGWVWMPHPKDAWIPVQMVEELPNGRIDVKTSLDEHFEVSAADDLKTVHPNSLKAISNMVDMEELSEGAILHNLRQRYERNDIYTYISSIVLSINPYKMLQYYGPSTIMKYREGMRDRDNASSLPPHVYALADNAYQSLYIDNHNQSIIISGESGAGKTEATKLVLQYLADIAGQGDDVEQQILEANPIIEAFGNAKTVRNNNSSRFGKWVEILFNDKKKIYGARIANYLLEKSRVVQQAEGERNYHIFYGIVSGCSNEEKRAYQLAESSQFKILKSGNCLQVDGINDREDYLEVVRALEILNFNPSERVGIFKSLAAILHVGNVEFRSDGGEKSLVGNPSVLSTAASLLGIKDEDLSRVLTTRLLSVSGAHNEKITTFNTPSMAQDARDALCKTLYDCIFNYIIEKINHTLYSHIVHNRSDSHHNVPLPISNGSVVVHHDRTSSTGSTSSASGHVAPSLHSLLTFDVSSAKIGVLDIFGFECFDANYFEQFCINYTNEKLQQHFNHYIFQMEQVEYEKEEIHVPHVEFIDNQPCLDLIESRRSGIIDMIQEEIRLPKGTDVNLLTKMHTTFANHPYYHKPKLGVPTFSIKHYAGMVEYKVDQFLFKNRDTLGDDIADCIEGSSDPFVSKILERGEAHDKAVVITDAHGDSQASLTASNSFQSPPGHHHSGSMSGGLTSLSTLSSRMSTTSSSPNTSPVVSSLLSSRMSNSVVNGRPANRASFSLSLNAVREAEKGRTGVDAPPSPSPHTPEHERDSTSAREVARRPAGSILRVGGARANAPSLGSQFRSQLQDLMAAINHTKPSFIRCIKPNSSKTSDNFDAPFVLRQLQYLGIQEVINIRQLGYPVRRTHKDFYGRYKVMLREKEKLALPVRNGNSPSKLVDFVVKSKELLELSHLNIFVDHWRIGKTKVLMKTNVQSVLEASREKLLVKIITSLQAIYRAKFYRAKYKKMKVLVTSIKAELKKSSQILSTPSMVPDDLSPIDSLIEQAVDMDLPVDMVASLKKYRHQLYLFGSSRRALKTAIESKDVKLIETAMKGAEQDGFPLNSAEYLSAKSLFEKLRSYISSMNGAIDSRNLDEITRLLLVASDLQLDTNLEKQAKSLQKRLMEEKATEMELVHAIQSRNIAILKESLKKAELLGFTSAITTQAHTLYQKLEKQNQLQQTLIASLESKDLDLIESSIQSCLASSLFTDKDDIIVRAIETKSSLTRQKKVDSIRTNLSNATQSKNVLLLESAIKQAKENGLTRENEPLVKVAMDLREAINRRDQMRQTLHLAIESRNEGILRQSIEEAKGVEMIAEVEEFEECKRMLTNIADLKGRLKGYVDSQSIADMEKWIEECQSKGMKEMCAEGKGLLEKMNKQKDISTQLKVAIQSKQENMIVMTIESAKAHNAATAKEPPSSHSFAIPSGLLSEAQTVLNSIYEERDLHQREMRAAEEEMKREKEAEEERRRAVEEEKMRLEAKNDFVEEEKDDLPTALHSLAISVSKEDDSPSPPSSQRGSVVGSARNSISISTRPPSNTVYGQSFPFKQTSKPQYNRYRPPPLNESLYTDAKKYALHLFPYLRNPDDYAKGKLFGKSKLKSSQLQWTKEGLPKSLTKLGDEKSEHNTTALNIFKSLQGFMLDRSYSFPDGLASEILLHGLTHKLLRDEIYLQCCKQINGNPKEECILRGFQLMGLASETFPPTSTLRPYLLHWLLFTNPSYRTHAGFKDLINFVLKNLQLELEAKEPPNIDHVTAFRERVMKSAAIDVHFPDGSKITLEIDPSINAERTCAIIMEMMEVPILPAPSNTGADPKSPSSSGSKTSNLSSMVSLQGYGIYMCGPGPEELLIEYNECLLDWPAATCEDRSVYFLFKKRMIFTYNNVSSSSSTNGTSEELAPIVDTEDMLVHPVGLHIIYHQILIDACHSVYDLTRDELVTIVATHRKLVETKVFPRQIGDMDPTVDEIKVLNPIAINYWPDDQKEKFFEDVDAAKAAMLDIPNPSILVDILSHKKEFNAQLFLVRQEEQKNIPEIILLGINLFGIVLIDESTKQVLSAFKFVHITGWANNSVRFCLRVLVAKGRTIQFNFATTQGKRITQCVQDYIDFLMWRQGKKKGLSGPASLMSPITSPK